MTDHFRIRRGKSFGGKTIMRRRLRGLRVKAILPKKQEVRRGTRRLPDVPFISSLVLACLLVFFFISPALADKPAGMPADSEVVVKLRDGESIEKLNARFGTSTVRRISGTSIYLLSTDVSAAQMVETLKGDRSVVQAEENATIKSPEAQQFSLAFDGQYAQATSGDDAPALYKGQWAVARTRLAQAQTLATGRGTTVAILDTGVDLAHPALAGRLTAARWDFVDGDGDPSDLPNGVDDDGDGYVDEATGHGTFLAGIVALVAPEAALMPVRILDSDGTGTVFNLAAGIRYAVDHGADVVNVSLGMNRSSHVVEDGVDYAHAKNLTLVASGGNRSPKERSGSVLYPARYANAVAVAATDSDDLKASYSNWGKETDLSAPGSGIYSTYWNGGYAWWSGTSMSAAFVSGGVALVKGLHPDWTGDAVVSRLTHAAVNIDQLNYTQYRGKLGAGRIDFYAAVR
ncbi:MAG: S8 family serine peptidase [Chloroflexi bacterium]|nr:S8 family serine peptidase [Chloroflexota bacterium]